MASRVMHLAIANEIMKQVQIENKDRFRLGVVLPDAYRVKGTIQTCPKANLFKPFRRFGLERRQPIFALNTKNPIKICCFWVKDFMQSRFLVSQGKNGANPFGLASILTQDERKSACRKHGLDNFFHPAHNIQSATDSHLKYTTEDGTKKTYKLAWYRETYGERMKTDELYLGYYLHLVQDTIFRYFVYSLHNWDPYPKGNIERLHNDYKLLNNYVVGEYNISDSLVIPDDINEEPIFDIYPFDTRQLSADFKTDFEPYSDGEAFFFTQKMADEYIKMATEKCFEEIKALENGTSTMNELQWAWDKNPPKQSAFKRLKNKLTR